MAHSAYTPYMLVTSTSRPEFAAVFLFVATCRCHQLARRTRPSGAVGEVRWQRAPATSDSRSGASAPGEIRFLIPTKRSLPPFAPSSNGGRPSSRVGAPRLDCRFNATEQLTSALRDALRSHPLGPAVCYDAIHQVDPLTNPA